MQTSWFTWKLIFFNSRITYLFNTCRKVCYDFQNVVGFREVFANIWFFGTYYSNCKARTWNAMLEQHYATRIQNANEQFYFSNAQWPPWGELWSPSNQSITGLININICRYKRKLWIIPTFHDASLFCLFLNLPPPKKSDFSLLCPNSLSACRLSSAAFQEQAFG